MNEDGITYRPVRAAWDAAIHGVDNRCRKGTAGYPSNVQRTPAGEFGIARGATSAPLPRDALSPPLCDSRDTLGRRLNTRQLLRHTESDVGSLRHVPGPKSRSTP